MRRNLFNYLEKLNEQDLVQIEHYLNSPYFAVTNRKRVVALFKYLKRYHPKYHNNAKTDNDEIARKLKFQNISNLRTNLLDAVSGYLELEGLKRHKSIKIFLEADTLDHLKINEFERFAEKAIKKIDAKPAKDSTAYFLKYQLLLLLYMNRGAQRVGDRDTFLKEAINALNNYFVFDSLKVLSAYKTIAKHSLNANFFDELNKIQKKYIKHCNINDPNIEIYYLINKVVKIKNADKLQKVYFKLKKLVMNHWDKLTIETQYEVYTYMTNIAKNLKNRCRPNFKQELFSLHQFGIKRGVHLTYGEIDSSTFYNLVCSASDIGEFTLCANFIEENQQYLSKKERSDILLLSSAYLNLKKQKFDDALKNLLLAESLNTSFKLVERVIELKCIYNINDFDRFDACRHRFIRFINSQHDLNKNTVSRIKIFIKITNKLFKVKNQQPITNLKSFLKEIEQLIQSTENLYEKPWLLDQFLELKK